MSRSKLVVNWRSEIDMRLPLLILPIVLLWFAGPGAALGSSPTVHVVITQKIPVVDRLLVDIRKSLGGRAEIRIIDLKGKVGAADEMVSTLTDSLLVDDIVLALGAPAARAVVDSVSNHPVVCAMTNGVDGSAQPAQGKEVYYANADTSVESLVTAMTSVWQHLDKVAVISGAAGVLMPDTTMGNTQVSWLRIESDADLISTLDRISGQVDGFVFPRDSSVLNRRTIDSVVEWLIRKGKPAIGYSRFLVAAGFPAAVGVDDAASRRQVVDLLGALVDRRAVPKAGANPSIWVGRKSLQSFGIDASKLTATAQLL